MALDKLRRSEAEVSTRKVLAESAPPNWPCRNTDTPRPYAFPHLADTGYATPGKGNGNLLIKYTVACLLMP